MRETIFDQLPSTIPDGRIIFVAGPDGQPGISSIKSLISDLNLGSKRKWVEGEFKGNTSVFPLSTHLLLTMAGISSGSLANLRRYANENNVVCPPQALTVGEVKKVLRSFYDKRPKGITRSPTTSNSNGNGNGKVHVDTDIRQESTETLLGHATDLDLTQEVRPVAPSTSSEDSNQVETALKTLDRFSLFIQEAEIAVLTVSEELKSANSRNAELQVQLDLREQENASLRVQLEELSPLAQKNKTLNDEIVRLRSTLANLENLIRGATGKK